MAEQGEKYRVLSPKEDFERDNPEKEHREPKRYGQGESPDHYRHSSNNVEVIDYYGDVINASENVPYPRGSSDDYRHVDYIEEKEYFEKVEE